MNTINKSIASIINQPSKAEFTPSDLHRSGSWLENLVNSGKVSEIGLDDAGNMIADGKILDKLAVLAASLESCFQGGFSQEKLTEKASLLSEGFVSPSQAKIGKLGKSQAVAGNPITGRTAAEYRESKIRLAIHQNIPVLGLKLSEFLDVDLSKIKRETLVSKLSEILEIVYPEDIRQNYEEVLAQENERKTMFKTLLDAGFTEIKSMTYTVFQARISFESYKSGIKVLKSEYTLLAQSTIEKDDDTLFVVTFKKKEETKETT